MIIGLFLLISDPVKLESSIQIHQEILERWVDPLDERVFKIISKNDAGEIVKENYRSPQSFLDYEPRPPRVFFSQTMSVRSLMFFPSPLNSLKEFSWELFETQPLRLPLRGFRFKESAHYQCNNSLPECYIVAKNLQGYYQLAISSFFQMLQDKFNQWNIHVPIPELFISIAEDSYDLSRYDANKQRLTFGGGRMPDSLDASIVFHEWAHAWIDTINPRVWSYDALVLHEGISDFIAALLTADSCFGRYDALEQVSEASRGQSLCLRQLDNKKRLRGDFGGLSPYLDSEIISGALWKISQEFSAVGISEAKLLAYIAETFIRLPKRLNIRDFFKKLTDVVVEREVQGSDSEAIIRKIRLARDL